MTDLNNPIMMSEAEILRGKLLSEETSKLICAEIVQLTEQLCNVEFGGGEAGVTAASKDAGILAYVELQSKRKALLALVQTSAETFATLAQER